MIEAKDIRYAYPNKVEALKGVSLKIKDGEFVAIMGQNGAGKSTLVKHFNGLLKPSQGKVLVDNVETTKSSVAALARNVGFVFQNPDHQLFSETVEEEIAFALKNFGFKPRSHRRKGHLGFEPVILNPIPKNLSFPSKWRRTETCGVGICFGLGPIDFDFG